MNRKIFLAAVIALLIDQTTKIMMNMFIHINEKVIIIKDFFSLYPLENYGAAWSIFNYKVEILIITSIIALVIIYRYMYNFKENKRNNIAFGFIIGGIFGNLIDRIFLGYVRDFLSFKIFNYHYPVFNFADTFIVIGVFLLIIAIIKGEDKNERNSSNRTNAKTP